MKKRLVSWGERYLYAPSLFQRFLSFALWPPSLLYCAVMRRRFERTVPKDFGIPVVSVGNLTVGGSGKTPLTARRQRCLPAAADGEVPDTDDRDTEILRYRPFEPPPHDSAIQEARRPQRKREKTLKKGGGVEIAFPPGDEPFFHTRLLARSMMVSQT